MGLTLSSFNPRRHKGRWVLVMILIAALFTGRPVYLIVKAWWLDRPAMDRLPPGYVDDASRLNITEVAEVWDIPSGREAAEGQLRELLARARRDHQHVAMAGARHSMGGHTSYPHGIVLNMLPLHGMELDSARRVLHVGAGARWSEVVPFLDAHGFAVAIMQSNNDFSVGGSVSVNCHGWQPNRPPIASTVEAFHLMKADGTIVRCSRQENAELFSLALGGYGLFGVLLDVDLRVVPNERYRAKIEVLPAEKYVTRFNAQVNGAEDVGMVFGRLCVAPGEKTFLREAQLTMFRRAPCPKEEIPALKDLGFRTLRREIYRAQIGSDSGKALRWTAEKKVGQQLARRLWSRNQLMNEGAAVFRESGASQTDILHEYFVPPDQVNAFLARVRTIVPRLQGDLLNVTIRNVLEDHDTILRYADRDMFAFVMLFSQPRTPDGDVRMEVMTRELIEAVLDCKGRYYLPYRSHATVEQFHRAYPEARSFFEHKRRYDPDGLFQNQFYTRYGGP